METLTTGLFGLWIVAAIVAWLGWRIANVADDQFGRRSRGPWTL